MIIGFRHKGLADFFYSGARRGIVPLHAKKLARILSALDVAQSPQDLNFPAFSLHPLKGNWDGFWSIRVNGNWRVTFRFVSEGVELVDYLDYH